jgi:dTDP-glucose pyrophosphorylase
VKTELKTICVGKDCPLVNALEIMDKGSLGIVFVVDDMRRLLGVFNDIDLRVAILNGKPMNLTIEHYMNRHPITISANSSKKELAELILKYPTKRIIPVIDKNGRVVSFEKTRLATSTYSNPVVILAGGKGDRLMPLTESTPKPMLSINGRPLLEITIKQLQSQGFRKIYLSVNYQENKIKDYFGNGENFGVDIKYIREPMQLGTAGPVALINRIAEPFLVINGDILTKVDFRSLLEYHLGNENKFTAALYQYDFQVPFGVANLNDGNFLGVDEKPIKKFFVIAGLYVIDQSILKFIPKNKKFDMTDLISDLMKRKIHIGCFPLREYWLDIGMHSEYQKANEDFNEVFKGRVA